MHSGCALLVHLCVIVFAVQQVYPKVEFTNVKCTSLDLNFTSFEYCLMKAVNRSFKYVSIKVKLHKLPISKIKLNIAVLKRYNGYRPFMYNITVDACHFLRNQKSNPVFSYFYGLFRSHSNMNHTCPYNHDIILEKLSTPFINNQVTNVLPVPEGDYIVESNWYADNIKRAVVSIHGSIS